MNKTHSFNGTPVKTYSVYKIHETRRMAEIIRLYENGERKFVSHDEDRTTERLEHLRRDIVLLAAGVIDQTAEFKSEEWLPR